MRFTANNFIRAGGERHKSFKALIMKNSENWESGSYEIGDKKYDKGAV